MYGFAKNERENIRTDEIETFKQAAKQLLALSDTHIEAVIENGGLTEITP